MPYKNDELDDLFKKAGNNYPLRTDSSNWENVAEKLSIAARKSIIAKKNKYIKYAVIVLLLSAGSLVLNNYELQLHSIKTISETQSYKQHLNSKELNEKSGGIIRKDSHKEADNNPDLSFKEFASGGNHNKTVSIKSYQTNISSIASTINVSTLNPGKTIDKSLSLHNTKDVSFDINQNDQLSTMPIDVFSNATNATTDNDIKSIKQTVNYKPAPLKFYGILYGSLEFSMVKFQRIDKPGYRVGIALGYRLNHRFDVEIGLQRDKINYYTDGKYFDKSGLKLKDAVSLEAVNGKSKLTSVPVIIKYNFLHKENRHFYIAAGTNAVVLSHAESYEYTVSKNGNRDNRSKNYHSVSGPKYFSSINTAVGYQNKLCNWLKFNVEPYYQIPTQRIGVGKLPVTSFGINLGIVKDLK